MTDLQMRPLRRALTRTTEPKPLDACAKCSAPSITAASDSSNWSAPLCGTCGHDWLIAVARAWDASLPVFAGKATLEQKLTHIQTVRARELVEAERAYQDALKKSAAAERNRQREAQKETEAHDRSRQLLELVKDEPKTRAALCSATGLSMRTLGRALAHAQRHGYVKTRSGPAAVVEAVEQAQEDEQPLAA